MALWGGRFDKAADPLFREINDSLPFDYRLAAQDIAGSVAWAGAIQRAGVLTADEHRRLVSALADLAVLVEENPRAPLEEQEKAATESPGTPEDIHSWVEAELIRAVGDLGKKLHTGRSRNDQAATGLRLWVRCEIDARLAEVRAAQRSLVALAEREAATILPGYTHLQRAQPVLMAHWALAYFEMLERDAARLAGARRRANLCPLGSAALAGTTYPIDRAALARDLGFDAPTANSLDAVADRDFVVETLAAASLCAVHLSRLGEELILWSSGEFGFVELDDSVTSGSSLMPQKKNPDALELLRGKCGRIAGAHAALTVTLKGLPLAYNKDMQEDKEALFDSVDTLLLTLEVVAAMLPTLTFDAARGREAAVANFALATDVADFLAKRGVPFREAHEAVGALVARCEREGRTLADLTIEEYRAAHPAFDEGVLAIDLDSALAARNVPGGTGPEAVARAREAAAQRLEGERG